MVTDVTQADAACVSDAKLSPSASQHKGSVDKKGDSAIIFQENEIGWERSTNLLQGVTLKMAEAAPGDGEHV